MDPKLFTIAKNTKAEELKKYVSVSVNFQIKTIFPAMAMVEKRHIIPAIGQPLFDDVVAFYTTPSTQTEHEDLYTELLEYLQCAVARLAYAEAFSEISVKLDDSGATVPHDKENRLYRYQEENLKRELRQSGFEALDNALELCENNLVVFDKYSQSPWRKKAQRLLVRSTSEFNEVVNIGGSRLVFMRMVGYIRLVEDLHLPHRIGGAFLTEIVKDRDNEKYAGIMPFLCNYLVYKSLSIGIEEMKNILTEYGVMVSEFSTDGVSIKPLSPEETFRLKERYEGYAESYLTQAIEYLNTHVDDYPLYKEYCGSNNPLRKILTRDNKGSKIFVV